MNGTIHTLERSAPERSSRIAIRLRLIGSVEAVDAAGHNILPASKKPRAVLAYLALNLDRWVERSRLAGLLWDRVPEDQGRASLRQALHELSRAMGPVFHQALEVERERLRIRSETVWVDAISAATPEWSDDNCEHEDLDVFSGSLLLDGWDKLGDEFQQWLVVERQRLEERIRRWNETNIRNRLGDPHTRGDGVEAARRAVTIDPTNEEAVRKLMSGLASAGQRARAILEYERCRAVLKSRLDLEPSQETQKLYRDLKRDTTLEQPPLAAVPGPDPPPETIAKRIPEDWHPGEGAQADGQVCGGDPPRPHLASADDVGGGPSVAILPFINSCGDSQYEYFADGLTEEVITSLACWRYFPVIARNSTFTYKGRALDVRQIGADLAVRYVVEGSVRRTNGHLRVLTQLVEAATGHHLLATSFESDLDNAVNVQEEIASRIVGAIEPELQKAESRRAISAGSKNFSAYDLMQQGMWYHYKFTRHDHAAARGCFEAAIELDPGYSHAVAGLVLNKIHAAYSGWSDDRERTFAEASALAQHAIAIDTRNPVAHFALGTACLWTGRIEAGIAAIEDAIALNPSFAAAHANLAFLLNYCGRPEDAARSVQRAIRLSPYDNRMFLWLPALAAANYQQHKYEEAIDIGRRAIALKPDHPGGLRYVVAALGQLGRDVEARDARLWLQRIETLAIDYAAVVKMLFRNDAAGAHFLEGLRKAGVNVQRSPA
ncbi:MAG: BTAD domain-containing putative transcriptional regulator [Hyphomicrobiaceae bacterium]